MFGSDVISLDSDNALTIFAKFMINFFDTNFNPTPVVVLSDKSTCDKNTFELSRESWKTTVDSSFLFIFPSFFKNSFSMQDQRFLRK